MTTARFTVGGAVQGVGFRWFVRSAAHELGVRGWVRNAADGTVEALAAGTPETLARFEEALRRGPRGSRVESVSRELGEPDVATPDPFVILR